MTGGLRPEPPESYSHGMILGRPTRCGPAARRQRFHFRLFSPGGLALALILALVLGGGLNLLAHHDHSLVSSDSDCAACRLLETPVESTPLQAERVVADTPRAAAPVPPTLFRRPAPPALSLDRPRGPPQA